MSPAAHRAKECGALSNRPATEAGERESGGEPESGKGGERERRRAGKVESGKSGGREKVEGGRSGRREKWKAGEVEGGRRGANGVGEPWERIWENELAK